jgi:hypothetical protein
LEQQAAEINAQAGYLGTRAGQVRSAVVLDMEQDRIRTIYIVVNPHKLERLQSREGA